MDTGGAGQREPARGDAIVNGEAAMSAAVAAAGAGAFPVTSRVWGHFGSSASPGGIDGVPALSAATPPLPKNAMVGWVVNFCKLMQRKGSWTQMVRYQRKSETKAAAAATVLLST